MSRYESKVKLIIVVIQLFAVLRSRRKNKNLGKISIAIGQRKLLREQMYRRTDEETMYCSITKISIQSVIGITNNFEALCTSLLRNYPWYTRRTWIEPQSAVTGMSVVNTHRMKWTFLVVIRISAEVHAISGGAPGNSCWGCAARTLFQTKKGHFSFTPFFTSGLLNPFPFFFDLASTKLGRHYLD